MAIDKINEDLPPQVIAHLVLLVEMFEQLGKTNPMNESYRTALVRVNQIINTLQVKDRFDALRILRDAGSSGLSEISSS
jgi:hypothetical protein